MVSKKLPYDTNGLPYDVYMGDSRPQCSLISRATLRQSCTAFTYIFTNVVLFTHDTVTLAVTHKKVCTMFHLNCLNTQKSTIYLKRALTELGELGFCLPAYNDRLPYMIFLNHININSFIYVQVQIHNDIVINDILTKYLVLCINTIYIILILIYILTLLYVLIYIYIYIFIIFLFLHLIYYLK